MFLPILDNPLHKVYRAERQEFSASFDIGSQTTAAPPQHFINHRKSNLKKPLSNRDLGCPTPPQKQNSRVRWNLPISSIRIIPAREDSDRNENIFAPNFSDTFTQEILENVTPKRVPPSKQQEETASSKPTKPNNQPSYKSEQYSFGNTSDSITKIIPAKTASEDIHYLNLAMDKLLPSRSLPKVLVYSHSKAQTQLQPAQQVIIEDTNLVARMNLRFLAQSAGQSSLNTSEPQSPASPSTIPGRVESLLPAAPNHLSTDKQPSSKVVPEHIKPVPLGSWSSENKPSSSQLFSDDSKKIEQIHLKRKADTRENERPSKTIKTNNNMTQNSREASPTPRNGVNHVLSDGTTYPDSDSDPPALSNSGESGDDAGSPLGDHDAQLSPKVSLVDVRQCIAFHNNQGANADPQTSTGLSRPPLMKVDELKVARWKERLDRYATLRTVQVEKWNAKLADALYELLCSINAVKMDPYLEPHVLAETQLAKTMKQFRHSEYNMATRVVADEITKYWRQMCRQAAIKDSGSPTK